VKRTRSSLGREIGAFHAPDEARNATIPPTLNNSPPASHLDQIACAIRGIHSGRFSARIR
jgi:hypothetical protein